MKKILLAASLIGAVAIQAESSVKKYGLGSYKIGVSIASYDNTSRSSSTKVYSGFDYFGKPNYKGIHLGFGMDVIQLDGSGDATIAGQVKVGYSLAEVLHWNAGIKAEAGYGYSSVGTITGWAAQYGIGVDTEIYKHFGLGYTYKHVDTGVADITYNTNLVYSYFTLFFHSFHSQPSTFLSPKQAYKIVA